MGDGVKGFREVHYNHVGLGSDVKGIRATSKKMTPSRIPLIFANWNDFESL